MAMKNMTELIEIATKYKQNDICGKIKQASQTMPVSVGFLGEFSSGKSTLINALLGRKVLPAMQKPTTKSIIEIIPDSKLEKMEYSVRHDGEMQKISATEFSDIALGRKNGIVILRTPSEGLLKDGFILVDTPGVDSLDKTDADITFGYLPFIDAVVLCLDINKGGIGASLQKFLMRPEILAIKDRLIIAITHADTKKIEDAEIIRHQVEKQLRELGGGMDQIADRIVLTAAELVLKKEDGFNLEAFNKAFSEHILANKHQMEKDRQWKTIQQLAVDLREILQMYEGGFSKTEADLIAEEETLKSDIEDIHSARLKEEKRFERLMENLHKKIATICSSYIHQFGNATPETLDQISSEMIKEIQIAIEENVNRHLENFGNISGGSIHNEVMSKIKTILSQIEIVKMFVFMALIAAIGPLKGAGNVVEGIGANLGRQLAKNKKKAFLKGIGEVLQKIDPVDPLIDFLGNLYKTKQANLILERLPARIMSTLHTELEDAFIDQVFDPIEETCKAKVVAIAEIKKSRKLNHNEQKAFRHNLELDIKTVDELINN